MIIDVNAFCGHWPFERLSRSDPAALAKGLRREGIGKALVSPIEGLFYKSAQDANEAMFEAIRPYPRLLPVAVADLTEPGWQGYLLRNIEVHGARAVKLHPNEHGYSMDQPAVRECFQVAAALNRPVIVQLQMQDARTQHPRMRVPPLDPAAVLQALPPDLVSPIVLGGMKLSDLIRLAEPIRARDHLTIEISWLEQMDVLSVALEAVPAERLLFATHQPFFYPACALAKVREARLPRRLDRAILSGNAGRLFDLQKTGDGGSCKTSLSCGRDACPPAAESPTLQKSLKNVLF